MPPPCAACAAPAAPLACARCRCAFYCSAACQRAAWGAHKAACVAGAADGLPVLGKYDEPQRCSTCGSDGALGFCDGCVCATYCDAQCQRAAWGAHRAACRAAAAAQKVKDAQEQSRCSQCNVETPYHRKLCGRCHTVSYCGEACARAHWKAGGHRGACAAAGAALFAFCHVRADAGYQTAMYACGFYFENGVGVASDMAAAAGWYTRAAEAGDVNAQRKLGYCYYKGKGVAANAAAGVAWYTRAAEAGNADAQFALGNCYREGTGAAADFAKAIALLTRAAEAGDAVAQYNLGLRYHYGGRGYARDVAKAREWLTRAAVSGDGQASGPAAAELAALDAAARPCAFYCSAACQRAAWGAHRGGCVAGAAAALPALGKTSQPYRCATCGADGVWKGCTGCGCATYCDEQCQRAAWGAHRDACRAAAAVPEVKDAHEQSRCSQCNVETPYKRELCGRCLTVSYCSEACARAHWTGGHRGACAAAGAARFLYNRLHAEAGGKDAMAVCGSSLQHGVGVDADAALAVKWFSHAAEAGHEVAQNNLGSCYRDGTGVAADASTAVKWYTRAAEAGQVHAQYNLGNCYRDGNGVAADAVEAVKWFTRAADVGYGGAMNNLAICYDEGKGVAVDFAKAIALLTRASEAGDAAAQYNLGGRYLEGGRGVMRSVAKAREWLARAAAGGVSQAADDLAAPDTAAPP